MVVNRQLKASIVRGSPITIKLLLAILALLAFSLAACSSEPQKPSSAAPTFTRYQDIPGITAEEIKAIEALKQSRECLLYGVNVSTEAFVSSRQGQLDGFARLLCERLSQLFDITFTPYVCSWDELVQKLNDQQVDFTGELTPTPERLRQYIMTEPIIQRTGKIFVNKYAEPLRDIAKTRPIRCAFLKGSTLHGWVKNTWDLPFTAINADDAALPGLFESGQIDAFIDENTLEAIFDNCEMVKAIDYFPLILSPVSMATANRELAPIIAVMQKYLDNGGLAELADMYNKGANSYYSHKLTNFLSAQEIEYIMRHNSDDTAIPIAVENDNYPLAFYNGKDMEFQGVALDVLRQVELLSGLKFKIANTPEVTWMGLLEQLEGGRIALVSELVRSPSREGRFLWTDEAYSTDNYALLSRADFPDLEINQVLSARVGLVEGYVNSEVFRQWFPDSANTVTCSSIEHAFNSLENGEIDLLMASQNQLLNLTNYLEKPGFKANIVFNYPYYSMFGFNKSQTELRSIVSKAQSYIDMKGITERWKSKVFDYNSKILRDIMPYLLIAIVLLIIGFATAFMLMLKNQRMSKNLESIVAQRTSELQQANRAKSDFLSRMSHEMRTPMNAIIGMTKVAEGSDDAEKLKHYLNTIALSSNHLLSLINDILDMSKIEAGKFELDSAPFSMERMLLKTCSLLLEKTQQKRQSLKMVVGYNMHTHYEGDALRLSQVVANLLSNAAKFTEEGGSIELAVDEIAAMGTQRRLRFAITDTGIGMSAEQIERLFNPFEQADGSISRRFGGSGLGLAISKTIVGKMNGKIWVESSPGQGSRFMFEIELGIHNPKVEPNPPGTLKLLLVSEDSATQNSFRELAQQLNFSYDLTHNQDEACTRIKLAQDEGTPYHTAFVDVGWPQAASLAGLLNEQMGPGRVTVLTSLVEWVQFEADAHQAGVYRYVAKPLYPASLANALALAASNLVAPAEPAPKSKEPAPDFSDLNLLLVEDIYINRFIFISLLKRTKINIDTATNGLEAVRMFTHNPEKYHIIVMDIQMPEMDGYEATRAIRASGHPRAQTIPIIAMTANAFKEDVEKSLASGMNDHAAKPIDEKIIIEKIKRLTGH